MLKKNLKRTKNKPENEKFSSSVNLSFTHACLLIQIENFILKSHVTFTKLFSNELMQVRYQNNWMLSRLEISSVKALVG